MSIKNSLIVSLLVLSIIGNGIKVSLTFLYYELDPVGFIEQLCENKDKPELKCNGKCHLNKITGLETKKTESPIVIIDLEQILLFKESLFNYKTVHFFNIKEHKYFYSNSYKYKKFTSFFRPPKFSV